MRNFSKPALTVIAFTLWPFSDAGAVGQSNPNTAAVKELQISPTVSVVSFKLTVNDPAQPVVVEIAASNDLKSVVDSLTFGPSDSTGVFQVKPIPGTSGKPHTLELTLPAGNDGYDVSLIDKSFTASPRYLVETTAGITSVHVGLTIRNDSPNTLNNASVSFQGGGISWRSMDVNIDAGKFIIVVDAVIVPASNQEPSIQPLAYFVNASDFKDNKANAVLQFPMKGNWPKAFILPGPIQFKLESVQLPPFDLTGTPTEQLAKFRAETIDLDAHQYTGMKVDVRSNLTLKDLSFKNWPELHYDEIRTYSTVAQDQNDVFVRIDGKPPEKIASASSKHATTTQILVFPGQENADYMQRLQSTIEKLPDTKDILLPIKTMLTQIVTILKSQEARRDELAAQLFTLVNAGASADEIATCRAKLNQAKAAIAALVESYNAWVKAHPM